MKTNETIDQILAVDLDRVPIVSRDRNIPRKLQAKLARQLFRGLGLKGISVTTPNYSMAQVVDVVVPRIPAEPGDYLYDGKDFQHHCYGDMPAEVPARAKHFRHSEATRKLETILLRAFPNHDNRSDSQSDYFDACWGIN
jgi:hypothetical protein